MSPLGTRRAFLTGAWFASRHRREAPAAPPSSRGHAVVPDAAKPPTNYLGSNPRRSSAARGESARLEPRLRPPGALDEPLFLHTCTRCNACAEACPHDAIVPAPARLRLGAGTPRIDPANAPCRLCPDRPCAAACDPGALRLDRPARMGTARLLPHACLASQGMTCSVCHEHCPVPGAITIAAGRPAIDAARCSGCGICRHVCPAPAEAILILPAPARGAHHDR